MRNCIDCTLLRYSLKYYKNSTATSNPVIICTTDVRILRVISKIALPRPWSNSMVFLDSDGKAWVRTFTLMRFWFKHTCLVVNWSQLNLPALTRSTQQQQPPMGSFVIKRLIIIFLFNQPSNFQCTLQFKSCIVDHALP